MIRLVPVPVPEALLAHAARATFAPGGGGVPMTWLKAPWDAHAAAVIGPQVAHYAATVLGGARAHRDGEWALNRYRAGDAMPEHIDQYEGRVEPDTIDRTVSASWVLTAASCGGLLTLQDPERRAATRVELAPAAGTLILWPGDWWHGVTPVEAGERLSVVGWWADGSGRRFHSTHPNQGDSHD